MSVKTKDFVGKEIIDHHGFDKFFSCPSASL
jgi:hypothetical protein